MVFCFSFCSLASATHTHTPLSGLFLIYSYIPYVLFSLFRSFSRLSFYCTLAFSFLRYFLPSSHGSFHSFAVLLFFSGIILSLIIICTTHHNTTHPHHHIHIICTTYNTT